MLKDFAISIIRTLRDRGHRAYLVGGCVGDLLLGRAPADFDVATDATPDEVMRIFPQTYTVGAQFGVVLVPVPAGKQGETKASSAPSASSVVNSPDLNRRGHNEHVEDSQTSAKSDYVEVATFRSDIGYSDGRHPDEVRFTKAPRQDA